MVKSTPAKRRVILSMDDRGAKPVDIAKEVDLSASQVRRILPDLRETRDPEAKKARPGRPKKLDARSRAAGRLMRPRCNATCFRIAARVQSSEHSVLWVCQAGSVAEGRSCLPYTRRSADCGRKSRQIGQRNRGPQIWTSNGRFEVGVREDECPDCTQPVSLPAAPGCSS